MEGMAIDQGYDYPITQTEPRLRVQTCQRFRAMLISYDGGGSIEIVTATVPFGYLFAEEQGVSSPWMAESQTVTAAYGGEFRGRFIGLSRVEHG